MSDLLIGNSLRVLEGLRRHVKAKSGLTVSEWADANRILPPSTNEPGKWDTKRTPYLEEIMNCMSEKSSVKEVTLVAGAQIGKSEACFCCLGYWIVNSPSNIILCYPTEDLARVMSKQRVKMLIDYTADVRACVRESGHRNEKNTILQKEFTGGMLLILSMQSAASLRAVAAKYLIRDEMDAAPVNLPGEGDPVALVENRQSTFEFNRKTINTGTPLVEDTSRLWQRLTASDYRRYFVPCPHCDHMHTLDWENVHWDKGKPETAGYYCPSCGEKFYDYHKDEILSRGEWRMTKPENESAERRGYQISSLYSPYGWRKLEDIVRMYLQTELDEQIKQVWRNTHMGLPYTYGGLRPDAGQWAKLKCDLPAGAHCGDDVMVITAGIDTQADRVEMYVYGWSAGEVWQPIDFHVIHGDLSVKSWWLKEIYSRLQARYKTADGRELPIVAAATDMGGMWTSEVYRFVDACNKLGRWRDITIQGARSEEAPIVSQRHTEVKRPDIAGMVKLWRVGVHFAKLTLYHKIRDGDGRVPAKWANGDDIDDVYFKQMTAEVLERKIKTDGSAQLVWRKKLGQRNEAMDCWNYAYAALKHLHVDWASLIKSEKAKSPGGTSAKAPEPMISPVERRGKRVIRKYDTRPKPPGGRRRF